MKKLFLLLVCIIFANIAIHAQTNQNKISAGGDHTLLLKADGTLWAWGRNNYGQLGDGTTISSSSPVQIGTAHD